MRILRNTLLLLATLGMSIDSASGQATLKVDSHSFAGVLHDNVSNKKRQGSGFTPLVLNAFPGSNLFRDDAVGLNFEHIFNGAKEQYDISMFTPRRDPCQLKQISDRKLQIHWPSEGSKWGMEARMVYDFSRDNYVDLSFECSPKKDLYSQGFVAMMWASYMNRTLNRKIRFWGHEGDRTGWVEFGVGEGKQIEVGTVSNIDVPNLPSEKGAQTLNLNEHPDKKFITPFYYGLVDGDHDLRTTDDRLLFQVLFDQTQSIRFAMWNFIKDQNGDPDNHSPAWDWQFVIREPKIGKKYGYRARVVVKPYKGTEQVWDEYRKWSAELNAALPAIPKSER